MKKGLILISVSFLLSSCIDTSLKAPCPGFGVHCHQVPINVWNYNNA